MDGGFCSVAFGGEGPGAKRRTEVAASSLVISAGAFGALCAVFFGAVLGALWLTHPGHLASLFPPAPLLGLHASFSHPSFFARAPAARPAALPSLAVGFGGQVGISEQSLSSPPEEGQSETWGRDGNVGDGMPSSKVASNRTLVYYCVLGDGGYLALLRVALQSLHRFGQWQDRDVLVITESRVAAQLGVLAHRESWGFQLHTHLVAPTRGNVLAAAAARLRVFQFAGVAQFGVLLYLDCDTFVNGPLDSMVALPLLDSRWLYAVGEGNLRARYHGGFLYSPEEMQAAAQAGYTTSFSTGIMLFANSPWFRTLFEKAYTHVQLWIRQRKLIPRALEQPFVNYYFTTGRAYNSSALSGLVRVIQLPHPQKKRELQAIRVPRTGGAVVLLHFCGSAGNIELKTNRILSFVRNRRLL
eukprot:RCo020608